MAPLPSVDNPYGHDVPAVLRGLYGVGGADDLSARLRDYLRGAHGIVDGIVERVHIAHGLAAFVRADAAHFVLKLSPEPAGSLAILIDRLMGLRRAGVPLPRIHRRLDGSWTGRPLPGVGDEAYLMDVVPGVPPDRWNAARAAATARALAELHRQGDDAPHQPGAPGLLDADLAEDREAIAELTGAGLVRAGVADRAIDAVARWSGDEGFERCHIHGDARLCHFLFEGDGLQAMIDIEQGGWGHRARDVAFHAVSHPDPARTAFLSREAIVGWVGRYDRLMPFTPTERRGLPDVLAFVAMAELAGSFGNHRTGRSDVTDADLRRGTALVEALTT